jgi:hypothetical protein
MRSKPRWSSHSVYKQKRQGGSHGSRKRVVIYQLFRVSNPMVSSKVILPGDDVRITNAAVAAMGPNGLILGLFANIVAELIESQYSFFHPTPFRSPSP